MTRPRFAAIGLLALALIAGCAPAASQPPTTRLTAPTPAAATPTAVASPTPPPVFAAGSTVAGVDVTGLSLAEAEQRLTATLTAPSTIELRAGSARLSFAGTAIDLEAPVDTLLDQASVALSTGKPASVPASLSFDPAALRAQLSSLAAEVSEPPAISVITSTEVLSRSFAFTPGRALDVDAAVEQLSARLAAGDSGPFSLTLTTDRKPPRVPLEQLREQLVAMAAAWPGVVGVQLIDLASGETIGLNEHSVFAGASTIKTAIMLHAYVNLDRFDRLEESWLKRMIVESDNLAANGLLAAAAGGQGTEYAFTGAEAMSTMLQEALGLKHTYLYIPFEASDYIKLYKPKYRCGPSGPVGEKPYTEHGNCLRAEPASMARLYQLIDQCARGEGLLLAQFARLSPQRCQEMLDRLATNGDTTRMVAGVPAGVRVEHKSGWIEDMQADVGIVRSAGGDYVLAIYLYRPLPRGRYLWPDEVMAPAVAAFSRLVYTAYNPLPLAPTEP